MCHQRLLCFLEISTEEGVETIGKRRFQSWVTLSDVQWVAIVGNVHEVGHAWLRSVATVSDSEVRHLIKLILKVHRWSDVYHMAHSIHIFSLIVLCKVRRLWFYHRTHIKVEALANHSEHQLYVVCIVFILRIAAQVTVVIALQRIVQS